jgi:alpha-galactosidase
VYRYGTEFDYKLEGKNEYKYPTENYSGKLNFRGLDKNKKYRVVDYVNNRELGTITGDKPYLNVSFDDYLLLEVSPLK